jgi:hypothetical protein
MLERIGMMARFRHISTRAGKRGSSAITVRSRRPRSGECATSAAASRMPLVKNSRTSVTSLILRSMTSAKRSRIAARVSCTTVRNSVSLSP